MQLYSDRVSTWGEGQTGTAPWQLIRLLKDTRGAGVSVFVLHSISILEAVLWPRRGTGGPISPAVGWYLGSNL